MLPSSTDTPPVGITFVFGRGPFIASINLGPPNEEPGKILISSAPNSSAFMISLIVTAPGI